MHAAMKVGRALNHRNGSLSGALSNMASAARRFPSVSSWSVFGRLAQSLSAGRLGFHLQTLDNRFHELGSDGTGRLFVYSSFGID